MSVHLNSTQGRSSAKGERGGYMNDLESTSIPFKCTVVMILALNESTGYNQVIIIGSEIANSMLWNTCIASCCREFHSTGAWMPLAFIEAIPITVFLVYPKRQHSAVMEAKPPSLNALCTCQLFNLHLFGPQFLFF